MKHSVLQLSGSQGGQMDQAGGDSHRIHLPHQGADPFFIPKDIGEIAPCIMVRDAQVVPIFMPSGEDVEVSPPPIDLSYYFSFYMNKIYAILIHIPASSSKIFRQAWKRPGIFSRSYTFQSRL